MNVPFEVNKDRLIAEINGKKNSENGRSFCTDVFFYGSSVLS